MIENVTGMPADQPRYRVGGKCRRNIYDNTRQGEDSHIGVMFDPDNGPRVVDALNEAERRAAAERWGSDMTRDTA
jgi:hypothetical protein